MIKDLDDDTGRAARDGAGRLASMPLSVGRYLRSLGPEDFRELGQWLLQRAEDDTWPPSRKGTARPPDGGRAY